MLQQNALEREMITLKMKTEVVSPELGNRSSVLSLAYRRCGSTRSCETASFCNATVLGNIIHGIRWVLEKLKQQSF